MIAQLVEFSDGLVCGWQLTQGEREGGGEERERWRDGEREGGEGEMERGREERERWRDGKWERLKEGGRGGRETSPGLESQLGMWTLQYVKDVPLM